MKGKTKLIHLYEYQQKALDELKGRTRCAIYYDMGLGKTFIGSEKAMDLLNIGIKKILCVCQKSKIEDWLHQFKDNYSIKVYDLTTDIKGFLNEKDKCVGIINYDLLIRREPIKYLSNFVLLLDESSLIQNNTTQRCKFIFNLHPSAVVLLSGTPGAYHKLWSQCKLLGWDIWKKDFDSRYCNYDLIDFHTSPYPVKVLNKKNPYKNIDELKQKLREHGAIFKRTEEVIDLPEQTFIDVKVDKSKEYTEFVNTKIVTVEDTELAGDNPLKKYLFARRLCGAYSKEKMDALKDLIESTDERLIIFYNWDIELKAIKELLNKHFKDRPVSEMNGHNKDLVAYENSEDSITLVQYQSGAMGLNLQKANKMLFLTPTDRVELYQQAIKRIHRVNQTKPCFYYRLIVRGSLEEKIYKSLEKQKDYNKKLFEEDL